MTKRSRKLLRIQKSEYVGTKLHNHLRRIYPSILNTYYQEFEDGVETVTVRFKNGDKLKVNVTERKTTEFFSVVKDTLCMYFTRKELKR